METTTQEEPKMTFNQQLIEGLWTIRNRDSFGSDLRQQTRDWLRQCIEIERQKQQ